MNYKGFNPELEEAHQQPTDYIFGAGSQQGLVYIPELDREKYLPIGEVQIGLQDAEDCATRSPNNKLEMDFTYRYQTGGFLPDNKLWLESKGYVVNGRIVFSDAFNAILSGTTEQGNSLIAPLQSIHSDGLIPKTMLPFDPTMTTKQYLDRKRVTPEMIALGKEFARRFTIVYERVYLPDFPSLFTKEPIGSALYAWSDPVNGVYPRVEYPFNHAVLLVRNPKYRAFDNYIPFLKDLAPNYKMLDYGYRVFLYSEQNVEEVEDFITRFLKWWYAYIAKPIPSVVPVKTPSQILWEAAVNYVGTDVTPKDNVPDEVACSESVSTILGETFDDFPVIVNTLELKNALDKHPKFEKTTSREAGTIVVAATGTGNGKIRGHCGIYDKNLVIMSNESKTGLWSRNFNNISFYNRYTTLGGMVIHKYRRTQL